ncbi:MAG: hypothetical protein ACNA8W_19035, partial [Bradymonadaceae bacterium]
EALKALLKKHLDLHPDIVLALPPRSLPRTPSGKVRRYLTRKLYLEQRLDRRSATLVGRVLAMPAVQALSEEVEETGQSLRRRFDAFFKRK